MYAFMLLQKAYLEMEAQNPANNRIAGHTRAIILPAWLQIRYLD
jgi:hypothetical protein